MAEGELPVGSGGSGRENTAPRQRDVALRSSFDDVPELYEAVRHTYPPEA